MSHTFYTPANEAPSVSSFVSITEKKDGNVHFSNAWGGFVYRAPEAEFAARFREVPQAEFDKLMNTFTPIKVTALEGDASMDGWSNDERWNGWRVPHFTKDAILQGLSEDGHLAHPAVLCSTRFVYLEETNNVFEITSRDGGNLPVSFDIDRVTQSLSGEPKDIENLSVEMGVWINQADRVVFVPNGETDPVVAFTIGNGWCWENMADCEDEPARQPAPSRRM
jgi:hypothetical protein